MKPGTTVNTAQHKNVSFLKHYEIFFEFDWFLNMDFADGNVRRSDTSGLVRLRAINICS